MKILYLCTDDINIPVKAENTIMLDIYEILNALSELVYIADMDNYELLYMNEASLRKYHLKEYKGKYCYEVLQGRNTPCEFCTNPFLNENTFHVWERYNSVLGGYFQLRDKLIHYNGKTVRFEIATDISALKEQNQLLESLLSMDKLLIDCTAKLHENSSIQTRIDGIFQMIGETLGADRVYLFEKNGNVFTNTNEWCNRNVIPQMGNLRNIDGSKMSRWITLFQHNECVIITDLEEIRDTYPEEYGILHAQDIRTLVCAPMISDSELTGFIGIDNPPPDKLKHSPPFFTTIAFFLSSIISGEKAENQLRAMSYRDSLTGLYNRNRFIYDIAKYDKSSFEKMGVAFIDLNGLKGINDTYGHIMGDKKLIRLAQILQYVFDERNIYRIGGDEFCVICSPIEEYDFNRRIAKLREFFSNPNDCPASMGYRYCPVYRSLNEIIKDADRMMYESKRNYYKDKTEQYRFRDFTDR